MWSSRTTQNRSFAAYSVEEQYVNYSMPLTRSKYVLYIAQSSDSDNFDSPEGHAVRATRGRHVPGTRRSHLCRRSQRDTRGCYRRSQTRINCQPESGTTIRRVCSSNHRYICRIKLTSASLGGSRATSRKAVQIMSSISGVFVIWTRCSTGESRCTGAPMGVQSYRSTVQATTCLQERTPRAIGVRRGRCHGVLSGSATAAERRVSAPVAPSADAGSWAIADVVPAAIVQGLPSFLRRYRPDIRWPAFGMPAKGRH
jgi:hypothetical protein